MTPGVLTHSPGFSCVSILRESGVLFAWPKGAGSFPCTPFNLVLFLVAPFACCLEVGGLVGAALSDGFDVVDDLSVACAAFVLDLALVLVTFHDVRAGGSWHPCLVARAAFPCHQAFAPDPGHTPVTSRCHWLHIRLALSSPTLSLRLRWHLVQSPGVPQPTLRYPGSPGRVQ